MDEETVRKKLGLDPDRIAQYLRILQENIGYFESNFEMIGKRYPDMHVAILDRTVIAASRNIRNLHKRLQDMRAKGTEIDGIYITRTYVREKPPTLILPYYA